jgi:hypothetical protein
MLRLFGADIWIFQPSRAFLVALSCAAMAGLTIAQSQPDTPAPPEKKKDPVVEFVSIPAFDGICRAYNVALDDNFANAFIEIYQQAGLAVASVDNWRVIFSQAVVLPADVDAGWTNGVSEWTICLPLNVIWANPPAPPYQKLTIAPTEGARIVCPVPDDKDGCATTFQQLLSKTKQLITGLPIEDTTPNGQVVMTVPIQRVKN